MAISLRYLQVIEGKSLAFDVICDPSWDHYAHAWQSEMIPSLIQSVRQMGSEVGCSGGPCSLAFGTSSDRLEARVLAEKPSKDPGKPLMIVIFTSVARASGLKPSVGLPVGRDRYETLLNSITMVFMQHAGESTNSDLRSAIQSVLRTHATT